MAQITHMEWLNRNSLRSYPVAEDASPTLSDGRPLPPGILVDARVISSTPSAGRLCLLSLSFTRLTVTAVLGDATSGDALGHATAILGSSPRNSSVQVSAHDGLCSGTVSFGDILDGGGGGDFSEFVGVHDFGSGAPLEARCGMFVGSPMLGGVSVARQDGEVSGAIALSAGSGMVASVADEQVDGCTESVVTLSLSDPAGFLPGCYPENEDGGCACDDNAILNINGVPGDPDSSRDLTLVFGSGMSGTITNDQSRYLVALDISETGDALCTRDPVMPDQWGRLAPLFDEDCAPDTPYGQPGGEPSCPNPPDRPPSP